MASNGETDPNEAQPGETRVISIFASKEGVRLSSPTMNPGQCVSVMRSVVDSLLFDIWRQQLEAMKKPEPPRVVLATGPLPPKTH